MTTLLSLPTMVFAGSLCFVWAAWKVRKPAQPAGAERRREVRYTTQRSCVVSLLGESETRIACRVLNQSRSGMRIAAAAGFAVDSQVNVEWESGFFVGTVRNASVKGGEHCYGLELVASNSARGAGLDKLW